jgi:hypothetical protein
MVYKAISHVTLPRKRDFSTALTLLAQHKQTDVTFWTTLVETFNTWQVFATAVHSHKFHLQCTNSSFYVLTKPTITQTLLPSGPPLWSNGQSSWLQIQRSGFDSRRYQMFWEVLGLERSPLSLVSTTEEVFGRKSSGPGLESREYGRRDPSRWPRGNLYPQKLALTSPRSGGSSISLVC